jgi:hypothetical protein
MEACFEVKSDSSEEVYNVVFGFKDDIITINCDCQAGQMKNLCKHRLRLLDGDVSGLINQDQVKALAPVLDRIDKNKISDLYKDLNEVEKELSGIEKELRRIKAVRKKLRQEIGLKFSNGF